MNASVRRSAVLFAALGVVYACGGSTDGASTGEAPSALSFPNGNNDGFCASNPSPECSHGTPLANKQLVLTFDDGPGSQSAAFSSWLRDQGIPATFFVLGQYASGATSVLSQMRADGHLVGNHTWDHPDLTLISDSQIVSELSDTDAVIAPYVAASHFVFRAPYGAWSARDYNDLQASAMRKYAGPVRWDIGGFMTSIYGADWDCWQNASGYGVLTSKQCGDRYLRQIADVGRGIVLMHDQDYGDVSNHNLTSGQGNTIDMVKYMVPILKQQGYTFVRLDQVPDIAAQFGGGGSDGGTTDAGGACAFDPSWQQGNANQWWIEYQISGSITSASLQVVNGPTTSLYAAWGKWVGGPAQAIPSGTQVIVRAINTSNQTAQTQPFGYLVTTNPVTACGGGTDGGATDAGTADAGGADAAGTDAGATDAGATDAGATDAGATDAGATDACVTLLNPTWTQGSGANNWWVEYAISASTTIQSAYLEVVNGQTVQLTNMWNKWVGLANASIAAGASVVVHAQDTQGHVAQTKPFGYLTTTNPQTQTCN
jgi:peptidoglycan/xylan/chitin deacetylase (PgdA/CDA1 family)